MSRGTRIACWVTLVFLTLFSGALIIAGIFSCWPIYAFWDLIRPGKVEACVNLNAMWYSHAGLSIFTDFVILALPLPVVSNLRLSTAHKTATMVLFGFGSFGVLASVLRLYELYKLSLTIDGTWDAVQSVWSTVEVSVFIICASVTGLKPFYDAKVAPIVSRFLPIFSSVGDSPSVKSPGSPRTPPWLQSMTRRLGRRRPGTGATPRLTTLHLGTMAFTLGFGRTRQDDGESAVGIASINDPVPVFKMKRKNSQHDSISMHTAPESISRGDSGGSQEHTERSI